jgi:hypothetical protein
MTLTLDEERARFHAKRERAVLEASARRLLERVGWKASRRELEAAIEEDFPDRNMNGVLRGSEDLERIRAKRATLLDAALLLQATSQSQVRRIDPATYRKEKQEMTQINGKELAARVEARVEELGITYTELGREIGRHPSHFSVLRKHGEVSEPIAQLLLDWLAETDALSVDDASIADVPANEVGPEVAELPPTGVMPLDVRLRSLLESPPAPDVVESIEYVGAHGTFRARQAGDAWSIELRVEGVDVEGVAEFARKAARAIYTKSPAA